jgi:hypothetical protein
MVHVMGSGFVPSSRVVLYFVDATGTTMLANVVSDGTGAFTKQVTIPLTATAGPRTITARAKTSGHRARARFRVT